MYIHEFFKLFGLLDTGKLGWGQNLFVLHAKIARNNFEKRDTVIIFASKGSFNIKCIKLFNEHPLKLVSILP